MTDGASNGLRDVLIEHQRALLDDWVRVQIDRSSLRGDLISESEIRRQSSELLQALIEALRSGGEPDFDSAPWLPVQSVLRSISNRHAQLGFTPTETAMGTFALKEPIFTLLREGPEGDPDATVRALWQAVSILDQLGLYGLEVAQRARDDVIRRQQEEILELSTPVIRLWNGILALPLIGTLDSARTQVVMESLLQEIVDSGSDVAIIDITGVPAVDTAVAQHLLKTVNAARLMGAECFISGIRPQIAQTIVQLGLELGDIVTKASLADAFLAALRYTGQRVETR